MSPRLLSLVTLLLAVALQAAPSYSAASIVNAADNLAGPLAPNTIATIYGTGLAYGTKWLTPDDIRGGVLPTVLPGTGVRILVGGVLAIGTFLTTLSFMLSLPHAAVWEQSLGGFPALAGSGGFLVKDFVLLGAAVLCTSDALADLR